MKSGNAKIHSVTQTHTQIVSGIYGVGLGMWNIYLNYHCNMSIIITVNDRKLTVLMLNGLLPVTMNFFILTQT